DGKQVGIVTLPADIDTLKAKEFFFLSPVFRPCVFGGTAFPACDFLNPQQVEDLIGPYTIKTTFYDKDYNQVTAATKPGRYGAVIEIIPEDGRPYRRFRTIYRVPDGVNLEKMDQWVTVTLPKEFGFDAALLAERNQELRWRFSGRFWATSAFGNGDAVYCAGLAEDKPGGFADDWHTKEGMSADRRYWVGLKRKLYGTDTLFPNAFVAPTPKEGAPAPVVHPGTLQEAGMQPDTVEKLDALCTEWVANTDEAFIACVVRRGVVVFNKAYGTRDGTPMTVHTPSYIASLTKMMSGACMMMVVDRGIIDLDDDIAKVLPPLRDAPVKTPLTLRRLCNHYNGGWDHWGDYDIDTEEMIAWYYPYLQIGAVGAYNGQGYALGSRIVEQVSGEALGDFYQQHLFGPLSCADTYGHAAGYGVYSTALDMAKFGQMMLNKGAYGNMRFFSEVAWRKMMPTKLTMLLGPDTEVTGGIGCGQWGGPGLSTNCISHGSASATTLIIDYDNDLIIAMTRNGPGANYSTYHPQYIKTVTDCMVK
ncbi:MAG TPA: serine hydrolase, partial [Armatimonadota bacterium]|nr:serine hydrolase [Armatimonadota bacterium]